MFFDSFQMSQKTSCWWVLYWLHLEEPELSEYLNEIPKLDTKHDINTL